MRTSLAALAALTALGLGGCFWTLLGGAAEGGYVAGQKDSAGTVVSDQWITTKIKSRFVADDIVKARHISVVTEKGVVSLKGVVSSQAEKDRAISIAKSTKGVKRVVVALFISP